MISNKTLEARIIDFCATRNFGSLFTFAPFDSVVKTIFLISTIFFGASLGADLANNSPLFSSLDWPLALCSGFFAVLPGLLLHSLAVILNQDLTDRSVIF